MNEVLQNIFDRRSVRAFRPEQIKEEELKLILDAALAAPTAINRQARHFTVVQDAALLDRVVEINAKGAAAAGIPPRKGDGHNFYHAPTGIFLSHDPKDENKGFNSGIAAQNILLAARSLNIGSVFLGSLGFLFTTEEAGEMRKALCIPDSYEFQCAVALGYPSDGWPEEKEHNNVVSFVR